MKVPSWKIGLLALSMTSAARADEADEPQGLPGKVRYQGVVPTVRDEPPMPLPKGAPSKLTWPGFQVRERGAARIFLQFTTEPTYQARQEGGRFVIEFQGASVYRRNNLRRLDARHFGTVVRTFRVRPGRKSLRLEIDADTTETPVVHVENSGSYYYVHVDFPPPVRPTSSEPMEPEEQTQDRERPE